MISGINGIFNKITNKNYDEKEEFTETSPLWLRVVLFVLVGMVVAFVGRLLYVKINRICFKDPQHLAKKLAELQEISGLRDNSAAIQKDINALRNGQQTKNGVLTNEKMQ